MRTANDIEPADVRTNGSRGAVSDGGPSDLTLGEAATRYDISRSSLRRKIKANKVPGAYRAPGDQADEWRIPRASLENMGVRPRGVKSREESDAKPAPPKPGVLPGYFIEMIKRERARRDEVEAEKIRADARLAGIRAESEELRAELLHHRRDLVAAHNRRAAAEAERESAQMEAWSIASRLQVERRRREEAEAAAAATGAGETWRARIGWSFFGVVATLGALALVASMLLDTLLFDRGSIGPQREEPGGGAPSTSDLAVAGDGSSDAVYRGTFVADGGASAAGGRGVDGDEARGLAQPTRPRTGPDGARDGGAPAGTAIDRGPNATRPGGSGETGDNAPAPTGPAAADGSASPGSHAGDVGSTAGAAAGAAGNALGDVADHAGDAVEEAAGAAGDCICGAVGEAAEAVSTAAGSAGGTVSGAAGAASSAAGELPPQP